MRSTAALVRMLAALTALLLAAALMSSSAADAAPRSSTPSARTTCTPPHCWVAGAINVKTLHVYIQYIAPSRTAARRLAMRLCRADTGPAKDPFCKQAGIQRYGCLAVAYRLDDDGVFRQWSHGEAGYRPGVRKGVTIHTAIRHAKANLDDVGTKHVALRDCTPR
ncbi:hypothetical protein [Nocardioides panacisoli]|uniref:DUF4189 domain-containing protein n=1 Tax=Nocardioides panacisoli TaxID=627624 RepID=A0ABP7IRJ1_9ACTN